MSDWAAGADRPIAWLSLDEADGDPKRFLVYLVNALQTIRPNLGESVLKLLQSPEPPPTDHALSDLINEVAQLQQEFTLVLDDYHQVDSRPLDDALTFLLDHMPPHMHLVVTAREDPHLPLPRYRSRGQLVEVREADLRFTPAEAAEFLNQVMGLNLSEHDIAALESRTEGWIVGLQLAALSGDLDDDGGGHVVEVAGAAVELGECALGAGAEGFADGIGADELVDAAREEDACGPRGRWRRRPARRSGPRRG